MDLRPRRLVVLELRTEQDRIPSLRDAEPGLGKTGLPGVDRPWTAPADDASLLDDLFQGRADSEPFPFADRFFARRRIRHRTDLEQTDLLDALAPDIARAAGR